MEVAIPTKMNRSDRLYPTCYKVDVGNVHLKIAIEVDGPSHCALEKTGAGQKERRVFEVHRVESVEILELGHPVLDQYRDETGKLRSNSAGMNASAPSLHAACKIQIVLRKNCWRLPLQCPF